MKTPDIARLHDYRLMLVGARMMAKFVLESHETTLKEWKHCRKVLECAIKDRESLATLLFAPGNDVYYQWGKREIRGKSEPYVQKITANGHGEINMNDLIPEWEWIVGGEKSEI